MCVLGLGVRVSADHAIGLGLNLDGSKNWTFLTILLTVWKTPTSLAVNGTDISSPLWSAVSADDILHFHAAYPAVLSLLGNKKNQLCMSFWSTDFVVWWESEFSLYIER